MASLIQIIQEIDQTRALETKIRETYAEQINQIQTRLSILVTQRNQVKAGLNLEQIAVAQCIVSVRGECDTGARQAIVNEAISKFTSNESLRPLYNDYLGLKIYSGFGEQRHDGPYGTGPRHGSIVFSVGLKPEARYRPLTAEELEASIYYLLNLREIQAAKEPV